MNKPKKNIVMKQLFTIISLATLLSACGNNTESLDIKLEEQNAQSLAYDLSGELAEAVINAQSYEEFQAARANILKHDAAFEEQIGGPNYTIFLEECNYILDEI